ncbi:hypothetical protein [Legionella sp. W05-934-2]|jgi:hypothetical protein|uniref:hypothetical protein n=1 Tax=Legionella sp. W05-934-2 TaxID=1198649 RepID=UPI00346363BD
MVEEKEPVRLIDAVDNKTHDLLFKVMQKLEGVRAEVGSKINSASMDPNLYDPKLVDRFKVLYFESNKCLEDVTEVIKTNLSPDTNIEEYRQKYGPELDEFANRLEAFINQLTEVLKQF